MADLLARNRKHKGDRQSTRENSSTRSLTDMRHVFYLFIAPPHVQLLSCHHSSHMWHLNIYAWCKKVVNWDCINSISHNLTHSSIIVNEQRNFIVQRLNDSANGCLVGRRSFKPALQATVSRQAQGTDQGTCSDSLWFVKTVEDSKRNSIECSHRSNPIFMVNETLSASSALTLRASAKSSDIKFTKSFRYEIFAKFYKRIYLFSLKFGIRKAELDWHFTWR